MISNCRIAVLLSGVFAVLLALPSGCVKHRAAPSAVGTQTEAEVILMAVGDVMLDRAVARRIGIHGREWAFESARETLRSADLAFCNLECPLSARGVKVDKPVCFKADPANVECLTDAGFDIVSLANNHSMDCSRPGLIETMKHLDDAGIEFTGAGDTPSDAALPTILETNGLRIAFLARNAWLPPNAWFKPDAPNGAYLDEETIEAEVRAASEQADVVIVSLHWGIEYRKAPQPEQVELAHRIIDAGANLILGHHPHVLQPVEKYRGGVIAYSLGNFLFDSPYADCRKSTILKCRLTKSGVSDLDQIPVGIVDYRPVKR